MIQIKEITKTYITGETEVHALKGVSINFRNSEFVSILGPSGCGKTTLLNIIGGLDKYTDGDLLIDGVSTKEYKDRDWDTYRNHSVGFVFQSYNLIPHQTVLQNVELALTLSGVYKADRRARAIAALEQVGLGDQIHKKPNAMSGGQMQRVAIARALVNNPDIILADEPTGALDTETSVQVMEILKNVSKERLVVMVTHNPELAEKYSTRIIRMLDGNIVDDSKPYTEESYKRAEKKEIKKEEQSQEVIAEESGKKPKKTRKPTMSFWTAFKLSLKNLFTKKGRTTLTSFAGSIGIIGIALILAVSQGTTGYINHVQETTLASYPLTLEATTVDLTSLMTSFMNVGKGELTHDKDAIYKDPVISEMVEALSKVEASTNDLKAFKKHLETEVAKEESELRSAISGIQYRYNMELAVYTKNQDGQIIKSDTGKLFGEMMSDFMIKSMSKNNGSSSSSSASTSSPISSSMSGASSGAMGLNLWQEMIPGINENELINPMIMEQYEIIDGGKWPTKYNEVVLVVNENNELDDLTLYALGLLSKDDIDAIIDAAVEGKTLPEDNKKWTYDEIKELTFKSILPSDCYQRSGEIFVDISNYESLLQPLYDKAIDIKVTGVIRPKKDSDASILNSGLGYTSLLTEYVINKSRESEVVQAQMANKDINIVTGEPFRPNMDAMSVEEKSAEFKKYVSKLVTTSAKAKTYVDIMCVIDPDVLDAQAKMQLGDTPDESKKQIYQQTIMFAVQAQMPDVDPVVLQGYFNDMSTAELYVYALGITKAGIQAQHISKMKQDYSSENYTDAQLSEMLDQHMQDANEKQCAQYYDEVTQFSKKSYEEVLVSLGCLDVDDPMAIDIYASSFENKDIIVDAINSYNASVGEEQRISYTDYIGLLLSSVTTIINAITYVLIAFVAISLIVSSIMIGVITLISVQERTKEIGILRAIGASKRDVSSMFNAETLIIGFASGMTGVLVTYLLCIPINIILNVLTGIAQLKAVLPIGAAVILVLISMFLTLISGLIPSRSASKKDPVVALRTE